MSERCPKCGGGVDAFGELECGTLTHPDGTIFETGKQCLRRQLAQAQERAENAESELASLSDVINQELRENGGDAHQVTGLEADLRPAIRALVDVVRKRTEAALAQAQERVARETSEIINAVRALPGELQGQGTLADAIRVLVANNAQLRRVVEAARELFDGIEDRDAGTGDYMYRVVRLDDEDELRDALENLPGGDADA